MVPQFAMFYGVAVVLFALIYFAFAASAAFAAGGRFGFMCGTLALGVAYWWQCLERQSE